jgi:hypothetical protein
MLTRASSWTRRCACTRAIQTIMLIAMAVSLAGGDGEAVLQEALRREPALLQSPDVAEIYEAFVTDGGFDFSW